MSFRDSICDHLAKYKVNTLRVETNGIFTYRGTNLKKAHILPIKEKKLNILPEYRERFFTSEHCTSIRLHQFFHHLNSSQAMCINLFYPLIEVGLLSLIVRYFHMDSAGDLTACFEKESEREKAVRRTNFDFHLRCPAINNIFFEVKYTEYGFAQAKADPEHRDKFRQTYRQLIDGSEFLSEKCKDEPYFLKNYQILRNLVHLDRTSYVVFLFPSANAKVLSEILAARKDALTDAGRSRVRLVFLEDLITFIEAKCCDKALVDYYHLFRVKYLPPWSLMPASKIKQAAGIYSAY